MKSQSSFSSNWKFGNISNLSLNFLQLLPQGPFRLNVMLILSLLVLHVFDLKPGVVRGELRLRSGGDGHFTLFRRFASERAVLPWRHPVCTWLQRPRLRRNQIRILRQEGEQGFTCFLHHVRSTPEVENNCEYKKKLRKRINVNEGSGAMRTRMID